MAASGNRSAGAGRSEASLAAVARHHFRAPTSATGRPAARGPRRTWRPARDRWRRSARRRGRRRRPSANGDGGGPALGLDLVAEVADQTTGQAERHGSVGRDRPRGQEAIEELEQGPVVALDPVTALDRDLPVRHREVMTPSAWPRNEKRPRASPPLESSQKLDRRCATSSRYQASASIAPSTRSATSRQADDLVAGARRGTTDMRPSRPLPRCAGPCARTVSTKLASRRRPASVQIDSGWNWMPQHGRRAVGHAHDQAVLGPRDAPQRGRQRFGQDVRVVAHRLGALRDPGEQWIAVVVDAAQLAVHRPRRVHDVAALDHAEPLMAEAHAEHRQLGREGVDRGPEVAQPRRVAGPGRDHDASIASIDRARCRPSWCRCGPRSAPGRSPRPGAGTG